MNRGKRALVVYSWFFSWTKTPTGPVCVSNIMKMLKLMGWDVALLTLSGDALHPDFLSENPQRRKYLEDLPEVKLYTAKGWLDSPTEIIRWLIQRKTKRQNKDFTYEASKKSGNPRGFLYKLRQTIGRQIYPFWQSYVYCYRQMVDAGLRAIKEYKPSVIVGVHTSFSISVASRLALLTKTPWVAYMMDIFGKHISDKFMPWLLNTSNAVITAHDWDFSNRKVPLYNLYHGYDPTEYPSSSLSPIFTIFGIVRSYCRKHHLLRFLRVLARIKKEGLTRVYPLKVHLYAPDHFAFLTEWRGRLGIEEMVDVHQPAPREEILKMEAKSTILLLLQHPFNFAFSWKFWEYMGAGRPILYMGDSETTEGRMLEKLGAGFAYEDEEDIYIFLKKALNDFYTKGDIDWNPDREAISTFAFPNLAKKWDEILERYRRK